MTSSAKQTLTSAAAASVLLAASLVGQISILYLRHRDLRIPYTYGGDAVMVGASIKNIVEQGWWLDNPALGLPEALNFRDFPFDDFAHGLAIRILTLFTANWGMVMNLYFLFGGSLIALVSWLVMRRLRIAQLPALVGSLLFAFLPYHFRRGQGHLFLGVYYVVPLAAYLALRVMEAEPLFYERRESGELRLRLGRGSVVGLVLLCGLVGSSGIYYSFFSCFLLLVAGALSALKRRAASNLVAAIMAISLVVTAVGLNVLPSIKYRHDQGPNLNVAARNAGEAEIYGLKLAQLVLPLSGHRIASFAALKDKYNRSALVNENETATLGLLGSIGFLALLLRLFLKWRSEQRADLWESLSVLNLAALLLGIVGGIGSLFATIVSPQIRAYNRVSIFIGFFSLLAVAMLLERFARRFHGSTGARLAVGGVLCGLALFGLYDQSTPGFAAPYDAWQAEYRHDDAYIKMVEASLPEGARVFELPYFPFPEQPPLYDLPDYGLAQPYLHSRRLRWSYGAMRGRDADLWQQQVVSKPMVEMLETLALAGFDALYIDRRGYQDRAAELEARISRLLKLSPLVSPNQRMAVYDLGPLARLLQKRYGPSELALRRELARYPLLVSWGTGFYGEESLGNSTWHWSTGKSELVLRNISDRPAEATLDTVILAGNGPSSLTVSEGGHSETIQITEKGTPLSKRVAVPPGNRLISFVSDGGPIVSSDPRTLVFRLVNTNLRRTEEAKLQSPALAWTLGCYAQEGSPGDEWRWCRQQGELTLENPGPAPAKVLLSTRLRTGYPKRATVTLESDVLSGAVAVNSSGTLFERELVVPPGQHHIRFHADAKPVLAPGDPREMVIRFENARVERLP